MSLTVTATETGAGGTANGIALTVKVLTGQAASPIGTAANSTSVSPGELAITPSGTGSWVYGAVINAGADTAYTAAASTTLDTNVADTTNFGAYSTFRTTSTTTSGTPVTVGTSAPNSGSGNLVIALLEILKGTGLAEDASSPASVTTVAASTATTAAFTPPAGSLLVAVVASNASYNGTNSMTMAVSDTSGLTWTRRSTGQPTVGSATYQPSTVWTAPVPGGSGATVAGAVATTTPAAPAGSVSAGATVSGAAAPTAVAAPAGAVHAGATIAGAVAPVTVAAPAGSVVIGVGPAGPAATSALAAPAGAVTASSAVAGPAATSGLAALAGTVGGTPEVFPEISLGLTAELQVNSVWTDVSPWMDHGPVETERGHPDESTTVSPSTLAMTLTNTAGEFTSQNPVSPFYPWLKPNIPLRVSYPAASPYLRLEADAQDRAYVNDVSRLDIAGSLEARIELRPSDWGGAVLACKWDGGACWYWQLNGDGTMTLGWYDSAPAFHSVSATAPVPMLNAQVALRVTLNASTGAVTFWTAGGIDGTYAQLGAVVSATGATSIATGASPLVVGYSFNFSPAQLLGSVTGFRLYNGIGGTVVADAAFSSQTAGAASWADAPGNTWNLAGGAEISGRRYRGHFEVPEFPQQEPAYQPDDEEDPDADPPIVDVLCAVSGGGLLRRYGQANTPLLSPMRRAYTKLSATAQASAPAAYWPMEDLSDATQLASGIAGPPMYFSGTPALASSTAFACSSALPEVNGAVLNGRVPAVASWTDNVIRFLMQVPSAGEANGAVIASVVTTGTVTLLQLVYGTGGTLALAGYNAAGTQLFTTGAVPLLANGALLRVSMELQTSGSGVEYVIATLAPGASSASESVPATLASASVGSVTDVALNPGGGLTATILGHCSVQPVWDTLFDVSGALNAWLAEPAGIRFRRLCGEEGIQFRCRGNLAATILMGAQTAETLSQLLQECADADRGVWTELRQQLGWGYVTRQALYNQPAQVTYDHDQDHLSPWTSPPVQDDQTILNDATITAAALSADVGAGATPAGGSSARAYAAPGQPVTGGRLSNLPPPAGIGVYDSVPTSSVNTANDGDLAQIASWMIHLGTVDQQRFPGISVDLANTAFPYFDETAAMDLGDRLVMVNPPPWLGPDPVSQLCQGLKETMWAYEYTIEVNGVPETPYQVAREGASHVDTDGTTLQSGVSSTAASLSFVTAAGYPIWTTSGSDFPFDVMIAGERITVTNITGSSSPQTAAVTRSVNGVVKAQAAGAAVNVYPSPVAGL